MSDEPQGDGWWQASDLKWYPPERLPKERLPLPSEFEGAPAKPPRQRRPVLIAALVAVSGLAAGQPLKLTSTFQGCLEGSVCYPPTTRSIDVSMSAGAAGGTAVADTSQQQARPATAEDRQAKWW